MARTIPAGLASELQSVARIIFGFLLFRHGMEQVFGFPAAYRDVETDSPFGMLKLLCLPGGLLMMVGLFTQPVALGLAIAHLLYWFIEPLPDFLLQGRRLFGAGGAPSDHVLLPGLFFLYLAFAAAGVWSLDRLLKRDASGVRDPRRAAYALGALRIVAGFLFIFHGIEKVWGPRVPLDVTSLRALAAVLELAGGPMLMLGLFTRPLAFLLSGEMAFAYFLNHAPDGFLGSFVEPNQEAAILNCFLFLFFWAAGPGAWSVDGGLQRWRGKPGLVLSPVS
jgi:putative oxidoreductase